MSETNGPSEAIPDVQGYKDSRQLDITRVGIKAIRSPVIVRDKNAVQHSVATFSMSVFLPQDLKGTHMSRFTQLLNDFRQFEISATSVTEIQTEMLQRLESNAGTLKMEFPYFIDKKAPVSGQTGMLDYNITLETNTHPDGSTETRVKTDIPVTTLCPCSKEISEYGAHSQRSVISINALLRENHNFHWEDLIVSAEQQASAQLYSQLKRADEKFVTEQAYDNPRFVEDLIREVATVLNANNNIQSYSLEVENFESIHNHSAWAQILS